MANLHTRFLNFEKATSITPARKQKLIVSRQALQNKIIDYFKAKPQLSVPKFYIQGSYKMGTMVLGHDSSYDVDLGIYFLTKPLVTSATLKTHVYNAVANHTNSGVENRDKCVRVIYAGDFDIDLPVYYKTNYDQHPFIATKKTWLQSDPKELCDWFSRKKDRNGQLQRLVKYFKYWANIRSKKMPSGIALTVWVTNNFKPNLRDDIAFYDTANAIKNSLYWSMTCRNPTTPNDDLVEKLDSTQKLNFKNYLDNLIKDANEAIRQMDYTKAVNIWRHQFGDKF